MHAFNRFAWALAAATMIDTAAAMDAAGTSPEARWTAVVACADRPDERQRHACVDDVLRRAGVLTDAQEQRDQRQRFGRDAVPSAPKSEEPDSIDLVLASVSEGRDGRLVLTTRDGTVWRQTESRVFAQTPAAGQTLTVNKGAIGNFLCQVNGRSPFRCARSR
jgi:hypothetical protein